VLAATNKQPPTHRSLKTHVSSTDDVRALAILKPSRLVELRDGSVDA
jgi:hypothetical protein